MKEKIFNKRLPLTVGIVSLLPQNHPLTQIKEVTKNTLRFSPLLQETKDDTPDIVISYTPGTGQDVQITIARTNCEAHIKAIIEYKIIATKSDLMLELYRSVFMALINNEEEYQNWCEEKWIEANQIRNINYTYRIINLVHADMPEFVIAQGYEQALQSIFKSLTPVNNAQIEVQAEVRIQSIADEPGNIEAYIDYTLPSNTCFLIPEDSRGKNGLMKLLQGRSAPDHLILHGQHTTELETANLLHANVQVIAPIVTSSHEWMKLLLFKYYAAWKESIAEAKDLVVVPLETDNDTIPVELFVLPEQGVLPLRISEKLNNKQTQKMCQRDLNEALGQSIQGDNPYCYDVAVTYERSELALQLSFRGKEMGSVLIPIESLEHAEQRKYIFGKVRQKIHQESMPVSIYTLIPQASA